MLFEKSIIRVHVYHNDIADLWGRLQVEASTQKKQQTQCERQAVCCPTGVTHISTSSVAGDGTCVYTVRSFIRSVARLSPTRVYGLQQ